MLCSPKCGSLVGTEYPIEYWLAAAKIIVDGYSALHIYNNGYSKHNYNNFAILECTNS